MPSIWQAVLKEITPAQFPKFSPAIDDPGFLPTQRQEILAEMLPGGKVPQIDPETLLELAKFNINLQSDAVDYYVGVERKGMSFLLEVSGALQLDKQKVLAEDRIPKTNLQGKDVLIVDDAIHTGKTLVDLVQDLRKAGTKRIRAATLLSSQVGLDIVQNEQPDVGVRSVFAVPEEWYSGTYQSSLVPAIEHYKAGSLPNRPSHVIHGFAANYDPAKAAKEALRILHDWPWTAELAEMPPFHGTYSPIFRGTVTLTEEAEAVLRGVAENHDHEQVKFRVFIDPNCNQTTSPHLCLTAYAIYYPYYSTLEVSAEKRDILHGKVCKRMLEELQAQVEQRLLAEGYSPNQSS